MTGPPFCKEEPGEFLELQLPQAQSVAVAAPTVRIVEWERKTLDLMSDGECRTFNQICLDLTDRELTAEFFHRGVLERSIWSLVASHKLEHTTSAPIYFSAT